jgi:FKBP-type peptidyl-prolyl cis-trans isomerase FkpA
LDLTVSNRSELPILSEFREVTMSTRSDRARRRAARVRNQRIAIIVIVLLLLAGAAFLVYSTSRPDQPSVSQSASGLPDISDLTTTASGLQYKDVTVGSGAEAQAGNTVSVHYTGWLTDGTKFDSSVDRDQPFSFPLGAGRVIAGWDEGVAGMKEGGKRILVIPADLGYGASGAGGVIPPNATLVFEVELLDVQ